MHLHLVVFFFNIAFSQYLDILTGPQLSKITSHRLHPSKARFNLGLVSFHIFLVMSVLYVYPVCLITASIYHYHYYYLYLFPLLFCKSLYSLFFCTVTLIYTFLSSSFVGTKFAEVDPGTVGSEKITFSDGGHQKVDR